MPARDQQVPDRRADVDFAQTAFDDACLVQWINRGQRLALAFGHPRPLCEFLQQFIPVGQARSLTDTRPHEQSEFPLCGSLGEPVGRFDKRRTKKSRPKHIASAFGLRGGIAGSVEAHQSNIDIAVGDKFV